MSDKAFKRLPHHCPACGQQTTKRPGEPEVKAPETVVSAPRKLFHVAGLLLDFWRTDYSPYPDELRIIESFREVQFSAFRDGYAVQVTWRAEQVNATMGFVFSAADALSSAMGCRAGEVQVPA